VEILSTRVPRLELGDDLFIIFVFSFTFRLLGPKSEFYVFQYLHLCELDRYIYIYEQHNSQSRSFATFSVRITENRLKVDMTYGNVPEHETDEAGR
jgi:hypothetical protein